MRGTLLSAGRVAIHRVSGQAPRRSRRTFKYLGGPLIPNASINLIYVNNPGWNGLPPLTVNPDPGHTGSDQFQNFYAEFMDGYPIDRLSEYGIPMTEWS